MRHVVVINEDRTIKTILTQTTAIKFASENSALFKEALDTITVRDIVTSKEVFTVTAAQRPLTALRLMADNDVRCVGIVNDKGKLVDELSEADLKGMGYTAEWFFNLYSTCTFFKVRHTLGFPVSMRQCCN